MRWPPRKKRIYYINSYMRYRIFFTYFPYWDTNGECRWWEWVTVKELYSNYWRCQIFVDDFVEPK